jgi:hypothetical protein
MYLRNGTRVLRNKKLNAKPNTKCDKPGRKEHLDVRVAKEEPNHFGVHGLVGYPHVALLVEFGPPEILATCQEGIYVRERDV